MSALVLALPPAPPRPVSRLELTTVCVCVSDWISDLANRDTARRDTIIRTMLAEIADELGVIAIVEPAP